MATSREPGPKPTFQVVETNLHFQSKKQGELVLDLDFPFDIMIDAAAQTESEGQMFMRILKAFGDEETYERVRKIGSIEGMQLVSRYFEEFQKLAGISVGESQGSSAS
jgi:hypothetical protein